MKQRNKKRYKQQEYCKSVVKGFGLNYLYSLTQIGGTYYSKFEVLNSPILTARHKSRNARMVPVRRKS